MIVDNEGDRPRAFLLLIVLLLGSSVSNFKPRLTSEGRSLGFGIGKTA